MKFAGLFLHDTLLCISEDGTIIYDPCSSRILRQTTRHDGYRTVTIGGKTIHTHRLVAAAWLEPEGDADVVNHIDGVKSNNHYTNLEWCTRARNNEHAYAVGLRNDNAQVVIYDLIDDVTTRCRSMREAGRALGCNAGTIHWFLKRPECVRFGRYVITRDGEPFPDELVGEIDANYTRKPVYRRESGSRKPSDIEVLDTVSGEVTYWKSLHDFAKHVGKNKQSIERRIYSNGGKFSNSGNWKHDRITYLNKTLANKEK